MEVLRTLSLYAESNDKKFLLIGGHAINFYGLSRQTGDLDIVVRRDNRDWWKGALQRLKYTIGQNDDRFARFRPAEIGEWPIDFMFVDSSTFEKMYSSSQQATVGVADVRVVSAHHLLILKVHALKHYQAHRYAKDYNDALWLLRSEKLDIAESEFKEICQQYATIALYEKFIKDWKHSDEH